MSGLRIARLIFSVAILAFPLMADMVCVSGGACDANWQPFPTLTSHTQNPGPPGFAYWDGFSYDAPNANIGYYISGTGYYSGSPITPNASLPYFANADGSAVTSFYFESGGVAQVANLESVSGQWAPDSSLGWYDPNSSAWGWIFQADGSGPVPQTIVFNPTDEFGLFFVPDSLTYDPSASYYTNEALNGIAAADVAYAQANGIVLGPEAFQHFSVFQNGNGGYYVGVNDRSSQIGDGDYNDLIAQISPVPEPGTLFTAAFGAALAFLSAWKKRASSRQAKSIPLQ